MNFDMNLADFQMLGLSEKSIDDYMYKLIEKLQYAFGQLDIPDYDKLLKEISDKCKDDTQEISRGEFIKLMELVNKVMSDYYQDNTTYGYDISNGNYNLIGNENDIYTKISALGCTRTTDNNAGIQAYFDLLDKVYRIKKYIYFTCNNVSHNGNTGIVFKTDDNFATISIAKEDAKLYYVNKKIVIVEDSTSYSFSYSDDGENFSENSIGSYDNYSSLHTIIYSNGYYFIGRFYCNSLGGKFQKLVDDAQYGYNNLSTLSCIINNKSDLAYAFTYTDGQNDIFYTVLVDKKMKITKITGKTLGNVIFCIVGNKILYSRYTMAYDLTYSVQIVSGDSLGTETKLSSVKLINKFMPINEGDYFYYVLCRNGTQWEIYKGNTENNNPALVSSYNNAENVFMYYIGDTLIKQTTTGIYEQYMTSRTTNDAVFTKDDKMTLQYLIDNSLQSITNLELDSICT